MSKQSVHEREALAEEQAEMWLEALERTLRPDEAAQLRQWLKVSTHRNAIVTRCKLWHGPEILALLSELVPVEKFSARVERNYGRMVLALFFAVSGITLTTLFIAVSNRLPGVDARGNPLRAETSYQTAADARRTIKLPDGGSIVLNTSTRLLVSFGPHGRDITLLSGEAGFDVVQDSKRPFRVHVNGRQFIAEGEGARFILERASSDKVELAVVRGQVTALQGGRRQALTPALLRARVTSGDHTFGASEGASLGPGWYSARVLGAEEMQRALAWQSDAGAHLAAREVQERR